MQGNRQNINTRAYSRWKTGSDAILHFRSRDISFPGFSLASLLKKNHRNELSKKSEKIKLILSGWYHKNDRSGVVQIDILKNNSV